MGIVVSGPACSSFVVRGVVVIGVLHLHPLIGVEVVAIGRVFVSFCHICCSPTFCLSLFEDAEKNDEKNKKNRNCDCDASFNSVICRWTP